MGFTTGGRRSTERTDGRTADEVHGMVGVECDRGGLVVVVGADGVVPVSDLGRVGGGTGQVRVFLDDGVPFVETVARVDVQRGGRLL